MQKYLDMYIKYVNWIVIPLIIGLILWHETIFVYTSSVILGIYCGIYGIGAFAKEEDSRYWKIFVLVCNSLIFFAFFTLLLIPFFIPFNNLNNIIPPSFFVPRFIIDIYVKFTNYNVDHYVAIVLAFILLVASILSVYNSVRRVFTFLMLLSAVFAALTLLNLDNAITLPISLYFLMYIVVYLIYIVKLSLRRNMAYNKIFLIVILFLFYIFTGSWFWFLIFCRLLGFILWVLTGFTGHF